MCYRCNGRGHKLKVSPTRRVYTLAEEMEDEEERKGNAIENNEYAGVEFSEEEFDERVNFVLHRI